MEIEALNEELLTLRANRKAKSYLERYEHQMAALHESPIAQVRGITTFDICNLGEQLAQFEQYSSYMQEAGTQADLGKLPLMALDIITAVYGASILPLICSVQPIEEVQGIVYFKKTQAVHTKGNVTAGDVLHQAFLPPDVYPVGYAGEKVGPITLFSTLTDDTVEYAIPGGGGNPITRTPVRENSVEILIPAGSAGTSLVKLRDDGEGNLLGVGAQGTIDYATGNITVVFVASPGSDVRNATVTYGTNYEAGATIPKINTITASMPIEAEIFVLGEELGLFKAFAMKKRFGQSAEDELMNDLTNEINAELGNTAIARLLAAAPVDSSDFEWDRTPNTGVSWFEHKQELKDKLAEAEGRILVAAGRGVISYIIAGPAAAALVSTLPGFTKANMVSGIGPQVYGTLDGVTIIRAPTLDTNTLIPIYKGPGHFDAPLVYSPYMPLFVTGSLPVPNNPLVKQGIAAVWAGLKVVVPQFVNKVKIIQS